MKRLDTPSGASQDNLRVLILLLAGPSATRGRQHLNVTILELSSGPATGGCGLDSDPDKLSFLSNVSTGGLEPPIVMTPSGISPERRESNNSTRSSRSFAGGGVGQQQQGRGSGSDVLADNNSDTYGPGGELRGYNKLRKCVPVHTILSCAPRFEVLNQSCSIVPTSATRSQGRRFSSVIL